MPPFKGHRGTVGKPEKTDFKAIKKLTIFCKPYFLLILLALVFSIVGAITTLVGPSKVKEIMDTIGEGITSINGVDMQKFVELIIFIFGLYILGAVSNYTEQFIMAGVTAKVTKKLRTNINKKINNLPLKYFDSKSRGDIISTVSNDIDIIAQTLGSTIADLVSSVVLFVGVITMMFVVNWILALVTIFSSLLGFIFMILILKSSQKYFNQRQENLGELNGHIEEIYTNHNTVKSYNAINNEREKFNNINHKLYTNNWKSQALSGLMHPLMHFAGNISYVSIFIVGVALILSGNPAISYGTIISFTMYSRLFSQPLNTLGQAMSSIQQTSAAAKRVFDMLDEPELDDEEDKKSKIKIVKGNVEFRNVRFGYTPDKEIIKGFSANIKAGQKIAIVGPTGAGKTTIVNLLMRFYEIDEGDIIVDGVSIKDMKREDVHNLFDMILQDTWLFDGTIRENLVYNKENVTDEELYSACELVGLKHFINQLKDGFDTQINSALGLSEGQKQQLTIARAMIKDSPLLILDEATSSVDTRTEIQIQKAMDELTKNRTSFVIAHRLSTIKNADLILVLNNGDIIEQGSHSQLLAKNGFYAELYNSQFANID